MPLTVRNVHFLGFPGSDSALCAACRFPRCARSAVQVTCLGRGMRSVLPARRAVRGCPRKQGPRFFLWVAVGGPQSPQNTYSEHGPRHGDSEVCAVRGPLSPTKTRCLQLGNSAFVRSVARADLLARCDPRSGKSELARVRGLRSPRSQGEAQMSAR